MATPLRTPLPTVAVLAALQQESLGSETFPKWGIQSIGRRRGRGQSRSEIGRHSVASPPKMEELTGVTIGPDATRATFASGTCEVDWALIWRTASMFSPRPCM